MAPLSASTSVASPSGFTLSITSMTPRWARADSTVTVSGTLTNHSGHPAPGLDVELLTATSAFHNPSEMQDYLRATMYSGNPVGTGFVFHGAIPSGATATWKVSFRASTVGFSGFGVYGLAAQAYYPATSQFVATEGTYLPYWPSSGGPHRMNLAWVWPLIDTPRETNCLATLTDNTLEPSLAPSGRLGALLAAGTALESMAKLTWVIDPALLAEATTMTQPYWTGGQANCTQTNPHPASATARQWLKQLLTSTSGAGMDFTPYADVDVSALSHAGLDADLANAYTLGQSVAAQVTHRQFGGLAWPAGGVADASVLQAIAEQGHVSSVLLASSQMPLTGSSFASDAVASFTTGVGTKLAVLLADDTISGDLGLASSRSPADQFNAEQDLLAQTAMIAAELPNSTRSIVVAPPRRWNPTAAVAEALLSETSTAPWLRPASLASLASSRPLAGETRTQPGNHMVAPDELSAGYTGYVKRVNARLSVLKSLMPTMSPAFAARLQAATAATESSAWRGNESAGKAVLNRVSAYVSDSEDELKLIVVHKATLAGNSGTLPVSVRNGLTEPIEVRVTAQTSPAQLSISGGVGYAEPVIVPPDQVRILDLHLHSYRVGSAQVQLQLVTRDGTPLPGPAVTVSVVSTLYGRAVLVLIVVAVAIFVLTMSARWFRKLRGGNPGAHAAGTGNSGPTSVRDGNGGGR
jgi:hypothetical protein